MDLLQRHQEDNYVTTRGLPTRCLAARRRLAVSVRFHRARSRREVAKLWRLRQSDVRIVHTASSCARAVASPRFRTASKYWRNTKMASPVSIAGFEALQYMAVSWRAATNKTAPNYRRILPRPSQSQINREPTVAKPGNAVWVKNTIVCSSFKLNVGRTAQFGCVESDHLHRLM